MSSGFFVDVSQLRAIQAVVGASEKQMVAAYNRALKKTVQKLYRESIAMMIGEIGAKNKNAVKQRIKSYTSNVNGSGKVAGTGRIWFGLNDFPVSLMKGSMRNPRKIKRKRDERGRFLPAKGARGATFIPKASNINAISFPDSFVGVVKGKKSIWVRHENGHITEAKSPIFDSVEQGIDGDIFNHATDDLMKYFEQDLRGRMAGGIG